MGDGFIVVVVEAIDPGADVPEDAYARTTCMTCDEWCWLTEETYNMVANSGVVPICTTCGAVKLRPEDEIKVVD